MSQTGLLLLYLLDLLVQRQLSIMKSLLSHLLYILIFFVVTAPKTWSQTVTDYVSNEFVVVYDQIANELDRTAVRDFYGITDFYPILGGQADIWRNITFPLVTQTLDVIQDIESLELDINNSGLGDTDPRARVSDGDFQYIVQLDQSSLPYSPSSGGIAPILPNCNSNHRIMGSVSNPDKQQHIIIIDQLLNMHGLTGHTLPVEIITENPGGSHANRVTWVIDQVLTQVGITRITYSSIAAFDATGTAYYTDLLIAFDAIARLGLEDAILNFSANLTFADRDITEGNFLGKLARTVLESNNILMISSAGNDGTDDPNVFPGCVGLPNEISVAGSEACFATPWPNSNVNPDFYDIVAEADDILTFDGQNWALAAGTSFAAPLVTAAAAQVYSNLGAFNANQIRNKILRFADQELEFQNLVANGRVLNATSSTNNGQPLIQWPGTAAPQTDAAIASLSPDIVVYPNPANDLLQLTIPANLEQETMQISIWNINQQQIRSFEWQPGTPIDISQLQSGYYLLEIRTRSTQWATKICKM